MKKSFSEKHNYRSADGCHCCEYCDARGQDCRRLVCVHPEVGFTDVEGYGICDEFTLVKKPETLQERIERYLHERHYVCGEYFSDLLPSIPRKFKEVTEYGYGPDGTVMKVTLKLTDGSDIKFDFQLNPAWIEDFDERVDAIVEAGYSSGQSPYPFVSVMDELLTVPGVSGPVDLMACPDGTKEIRILSKNGYFRSIPIRKINS